MTIDRTSSIPLYYQLKMHIIEMIKKSDLRVGERFPTEGDLCTQFGLSRYPIRQALNELEQEGWLFRLRGRGAYVSEPRVQLSVIWQLIGFSEDMERKGHKVETRVIENRIVGSRTDVARNLAIRAETPVVYISRLRLLDGNPYLVDYVYVRSDLCPGLENIDLNNKSLFRTFSEQYGIEIARANRTLMIESAKSPAARLLKLRPGTPLFKITDVCFMKTNIPIQFAVVLINNKRSEFVFELSLEHSIRTSKSVAIGQPANPSIRKK